MTRAAATWLIAILTLGAAVGAWRWHAMRALDPDVIIIAGGDGGGLPRADLRTEGFDADMLRAAASFGQGAGALLISRHGHLLLEQYASGVSAEALVDGGELYDTLLMLAAGTAVAQYGLNLPVAPELDAAELTVAITAASRLSYPLFLSRNVWQPLNAAPAQWRASTMRARASDWLRVAEVLLHDGRFEGTQVVPAGWVQRHARAHTAAGVTMLRGPGATRMWLVPRFDVAILRVAAAPPPGAAVDETRLPDLIVRGLHDRAAAGGAS